jgi:NADPH:quinone reductase-like Zn-dependent oxidoreductase
MYTSSDLGFLWQVPLLALLTWRLGDKKVRLPMSRVTQEDIVWFKRLIEAGEYRPVVDRTYPLDQIVEATAYVESGQKVGNVVLTISDQADRN